MSTYSTAYKSGTFDGAPTSGSTTFNVSGITLASSDVGRILWIRTGNAKLQHRKITAVSGSQITVAHPWDTNPFIDPTSDNRASDVLPSSGDAFVLSYSARELAATDSDMTLTNENNLKLTGTLRVNPSALIFFEGLNVEFDARNIEIAGVSSGVGGGLIFGYYEYVAGEDGYFTDVCNLVDLASGVSDDQMATSNGQNDSFGMLDIYGGTLRTVDSCFWRAYRSVGQEEFIQSRWIGLQIDGSFGSRADGNRSIVAVTNVNSNSTVGIMNPRTPVARVEFTSLNSDQAGYVFLSQGPAGRAVFNRLVDIGVRLFRVASSGGSGEVYEFTAKKSEVDPIPAVAVVEGGTSGHTLRYGNLVRPAYVDSANVAVTETIKTRLYDDGNVFVAENSITNGQYPEEFVRHTDWSSNSGTKTFANGTLYAPYSLRQVSYGKQFTTSVISVEDTYEPATVLLDDLSITESDKAIVDAYTELETPEKLYDRAVAWIIDNITDETGFLVARSGVEIDAGSYNVVIDATASPAIDVSGNTITIHADTFTGDMVTTGVITLANGAVFNGTRTDANGTIAPPTGLTVTATESSSTIVIYQAGTQTVLANTVGTSTTYSSTSPVAAVDYVVLKAGFEPIRVAGITLTSGTVPTRGNSQRTDIEYETPTGDVTLANYATNWTVDTVAEEIDVSSGSSTVRNVYSAMMDLWIDSADGVGANPAVANQPFPISPEGPKRFTFAGAWVFTAGSLARLSRAGFEYTDLSQVFSGITDRQSNDQDEQWAYQQSQGGATISGTGRLDRVLRTDNASTYLTIKRLANGFAASRFNLIDTFSQLEADQYDFTLPAEPLAEGAGTATGITFETGTFVVGGETFSIRITSDLTGAQIRSNLSAYRENDPATYFTYPQMVEPSGSDYATERGLFEDTGLQAGTYVRTTGGVDHPDFTQFEADNGNLYVPPSTTPISIIDNSANTIILLDDSDVTQDLQTNVTGTYNFNIPASATGTWRVVIDRIGAIASSFDIPTNGLNQQFSGVLQEYRLADNSLMLTGATSPLCTVAFSGGLMRIFIGNGSVTPQQIFTTTETALITEDGLKFRAAGGGVFTYALAFHGTDGFLGANVRIDPLTNTDINNQVQAFLQSSDGTIQVGDTIGLNYGQVTQAQITQQFTESLVHYDSINGTAGTGSISGTPIGTPAVPSSILSDALAIASTNNLFGLKLLSNISLDQNVEQFKIVPRSIGAAQVNCLASFSYAGSTFDSCGMFGDLGGTSALIRTVDSALINTTNVCTSLNRRVRLIGTITVAAGADVDCNECFTDDESGVTVIDLQAHGDNFLELQGLYGCVEIRGVTGSAEVFISTPSAQVTLDASCTGGTIKITGTGKLTNNSAGSAIDEVGFNPGGTNGGSGDATEAKQDQILTRLSGIEGAGFDTATDSLEQIRDNLASAGPTAADIADAVWDEPIADHNTAGSTGEALGATPSGTVDANIIQVNGAATTDINDFKADTTGLSTFDPANDTVARVTLVDTTTVNTDMRGTDGANTTAPANADVAAIKLQTDRMNFNGSNEILSDPQTVSSVNPQDVRDAMKLAPSPGAPAAGSIDAELDAIPTNPALSTDTRLDNLDATVSSRLADADYTAPDNAAITSIETKIDTIDTNVDQIETTVNTIDGKVDNINTNVDSTLTQATNAATSSAAVDTRLPANPADVSDVPTAEENALELLDGQTAP